MVNIIVEHAGEVFVISRSLVLLVTRAKKKGRISRDIREKA